MAQSTASIWEEQRPTEVDQNNRPPTASQDSEWRYTSLLPQLMSPVGPLLALSGLANAWYVKEDENGRITRTKPDSTAILAVGGTILALTFLSDFSLLMRLFNRNPRFYSLLTLFLLSSHWLLLLIFDTILTVCAHQNRLDGGYHLSAAFYMSIAAASAAALVSVLLILDGFRTSWWKKGGTGISSKQKGLVLAFNVFVGILLIATVMFRHLLPQAEDSNYLDSLYFSIQASSTIGFGSPAPVSKGARIATVLYFPFAIISFACLIGFTVGTVIEGLQKSYESQERRILGLLEPKPGEVAQLENLSKSIINLHKSNRAHARAQLIVAIVSVICVTTVGSAVFSALEGWSYGLSIYFAAIASTTVGFGDVIPSTQSGKAFFCIWILISVASITILFSVLADQFSSSMTRSLTSGCRSRKRNIFQHLHCKSLRTTPSATPSPRLPPPSDLTATVPTLNRLTSSGSEQPLMKEEREKIEKDSEKLVELVKELRHKLGGSLGEEDHTAEVVSAKMDKERFDENIRCLVDADPNLQQFLYQRAIRDVFDELENLAMRINERSDRGS